MPTITSLSPTSGPTTGGTSVTITGAGYNGPTTVRFGATATTLTLDSPTRITAIAPGGPAGTAAVGGSVGTAQVTVTGPGGTSNGLGYSYM
ncbi:IPT/TIG domain-containing protein [Nocardia grenadensis]|uniref:IPT/TIG domain-containing protein n=1 Tax=Nocardia grenadensis TaxID=931537 RepID=UPI000A02F3DA|nr:IPT/TIG domain-containing protein [Nocardia grenadensis]